MKTSLQLKLGQSLTMTPQLQQAIRLLQLSTLDLQQEIQQAVESNPMLEIEDENNFSQHDSKDNAESIDNIEQADRAQNQDNSASLSSSSQKDERDNQAENTNTSADSNDIEADSDWSDQIPEFLSTDSSWDDTYQSNTGSSSGSASGEDYDFESKDTSSDSLNDHLLWQLNLTPLSDRDRLIAEEIVDGIDESGYLTIPLEDVLQSLESLYQKDEHPLELDEIQAVLTRIQQFDPPGVGARNLSECLTIQLKQLPEALEWRKEALLVTEKYIHLLGSRDFAQIMRKAKLKEYQLKEIITLIKTLAPKPGETIHFESSEYVIPDVIVKKVKDQWVVELNPEIAPKLKINSGYASLIKRADSSADNTYLKNNLQEAKWFLKSIQSRNETLLKVSTCIVDHQRNFFDYGPEAMKPLVLHDIAERVEMHESTISRVTTQKFMHTPRGIFELKYFFSSHVSTDSGGECSSTAIRAIIKKLVTTENPQKPLSDSKIAIIIADQGINVARRTIAKYREALHIPPSNERKRLV